MYFCSTISFYAKSQNTIIRNKRKDKTTSLIYYE